jgi:hypothetical protein
MRASFAKAVREGSFAWLLGDGAFRGGSLSEKGALARAVLLQFGEVLGTILRRGSMVGIGVGLGRWLDE